MTTTNTIYTVHTGIVGIDSRLRAVCLTEETACEELDSLLGDVTPTPPFEHINSSEHFVKYADHRTAEERVITAIGGSPSHLVADSAWGNEAGVIGWIEMRVAK